MSDIVAEIRGHLHTMAPHQRARLTAEQLRQAADEIERLRLTEEEREAIEGAIASEHGRGAWAWADTLRGLLDRLGHQEGRKNDGRA